MYNKKLLKNIVDGLDKAKKPKAAKDIIYDPKGQWKHPGEVTRIPSSSITMKGVGYPVLGVPNKGAPSMMQPNQAYNFPEADYVDEYPHMDGGGQIYTYAARPGSYYKKDVNGKWLIKNEGTKGKYIAVDDPKGTRTKALNAQAKPMPAKKPIVQQSKYDPLYDTSSVQKAGTTQVSNLMKRDTPEFITNPIKYKHDQEVKAKKEVRTKVQDKNKKVKQFYEEYHESPRYTEMIQNSDPENWTDFYFGRKENLKGPHVVVKDKQPLDEPNTGGFSMSDTGWITVLPQGQGVNGLLPHEWSHSTDRPLNPWSINPYTNKRYNLGNNNTDRLIPARDEQWIAKHRTNDWYHSPEFQKLPLEEKKIEWRNVNDPWYKANAQQQKEWYDYVGKDTETRARLNDIRYQSKERGIYDPFTEKVSPATYKKLLNTKFESGDKEGFDALKQLKDVYTDEEIQWMLNNISKNENQEEDVNEGMARKGGSLKSKKYTRNLDGTNYLFAESSLFKKPKKLSKKRIFHPHAKYYKTGGALLTKKVTCTKCGWTWNAADGGDDMTTCHKCGGQGLIHAQGGGDYIEADLTPEKIQEYAKGGYIVEDVSIPSLNQKQVGGPQGPPLLVNNALLTSNQKIAAAAHASPTRENAANLQSLKDQKVKEEADKAARIAAYKKKQAEEKAKAEGIAKWYEEEKKRRAEEEVLFGNNGVQASDATRVDIGYLSPLVGIAKREEQDKRNQEDKIYNSQQNAIKKGYKTIYDYENDPMGAKWDQAQANEAAWLQSGAERPMVNTGEMGYNKGFKNDKSGWDPITKKYYTKTGIYDPKTKKWKPNPSYFKGSGAIQSVDEVWAAPIAIPAALEGIGALAALEIPGLGATVGQAVNAGFVAHGVSKLPETGGAWYDAYKSGTGDYRDAIEKTFWNALDFAGAGELKSPLKLQAATAEKTLAETPLQKFMGKTGVTAKEIANTHVDDFDSMAFTDDFDNLLTERYMQDDLAEAFRRIENRSNQLPKPPNELYIDPVHLEPALAGDGSKAALTAERDWLMDEYKSLGLENYDNYINDAPQAISQRASELEVEIATLNNRLRTQVQNATTSSPAAADIMNFRNQPGYISSTEEAVNEIPFLSDEALNAKYDHLSEEQVDLMFNTANVPMTPEAKLRYDELNNILRDVSRERNHRAAVDNAFTTRVQLPVDDIEEFAHNPFAGLRGERDIEITPLRRDTALRINSNVVPGTGGRTVAETLAMHDNPLNAMIDVRRFAQEGIIGENSAADLMTSLRQEIKKMPIKGDEKKFFIKEAKRISNVPKDVPYTGSALTDRELDKLMTAIPLEERTAIFDKYGYTVDDLIQFDGKYGANDQLMNVAQNQVYDDIRYLRDHGIPNPNPPVINFKTGEISELLQQESELANIGLSEETLKTINETRYSGTLNEQRVKPKTSGVVEYNYVEEQQIHKLKDISIIPETKDLDKLIKSYEEAVSKLKDGDIKDALTTQLEDYKSTKWLRTEYADELKAQGLTPSEIEKASIISNHGGRKNIIDGKGNVVGTLNAYAAKTYEGTKGFKIGSTGVNYKFHPYNLKHSKFKSWDKAQEYFEKQVLEKNLATITNEADRTNPIMIKHFKRQAKVKAEELVKQLQDNNNNRWGEALYRGVHHGVKDTKGPVFTDQHFVSTSLPDAFTGTKIERYRAENYWNSQMKQLNELGVPKAAAVKMPSTHPAYSQYDINDLNNLPPTNLVIKRKQGGDIDKLNKFIY